MGLLKRYYEDRGDLDYPHPHRDQFESDIEYDEYRYHKQLEEARN
tara:strand:+ start:469 stop:603 length:135 start_codon:yes stop_codon:yes gene_type:complete